MVGGEEMMVSVFVVLFLGIVLSGMMVVILVVFPMVF
jgi:hypothetical protein